MEKRVLWRGMSVRIKETVSTYLVIDDRIAKLQERKTVKERRKNVQKDLAHDVRHITIVSGKGSLEKLLSLGPGRSSILASTVDIFCNRLAFALLFDFCDFLAQRLVFIALRPDLGPVLVPGTADDVNGPFTD